MKFNKYQQEAWETALESAKNLEYLILKLNGESGEVAELLGKAIRDDNWKNFNENIAKELGDVLWYTSSIAMYLGYDLDYIAELNITKLQDRKARGKISGSGDNR